MANYYRYYSVRISLPSKEAQVYALALAARLQTVKWGRDEVREFNVPLRYWCPGIIEADDSQGPGLWIYSHHHGDDEFANPGHAALFISHLLAKYLPQEYVSFAYSCDCDKPRLDAFGGGAVFVTATDIRVFSSSKWLAEQEASNNAHATIEYKNNYDWGIDLQCH